MNNYFNICESELLLMIEEEIINKNQYEILKQILEMFKIVNIKNTIYINKNISIIKNKFNIAVLINKEDEEKTYIVNSTEELIALIYEKKIMQIYNKVLNSTLEIKSNARKDIEVIYHSAFFKKIFNTKISVITNQELINKPKSTEIILNTLLYKTTIKFIEENLTECLKKTTLPNTEKQNTI